MGYMYQGDAAIYASLTVEVPRPLDNRTVVEDIEQLYNISETSAYQGMTVANINDGNLYMLIDKNKIREKAGWKASYESIQIITCTQEEYDTWADNTTEDYKPNDESLPYLRRDVYYYIYEDDEKSQYYVTRKQIDEWLNAKAQKADLDGLMESFDAHVIKYNQESAALNTSIVELSTKFNDYSTSAQLQEIYATKDSLKETDDKFVNYYTSEEIDTALDLYVLKSSLKGGIEGDDDETYVFVTQSQYESDKLLNSKNITTQALTLLTKVEEGDDITKTITVTKDSVLVEGKELAFTENVPKIEIVESKAKFDAMPKKDEKTYYYICDDETIGYITNKDAENTYFSKSQVNDLIALAKQELIDNYIIPLQEEIAALKGL